ncbi:MAG: hypothetical protein IJD60_01975 [Clostridia bacterium]|nr:hypothetical protein [Clostridia bacterium]
MNAVTAFDNRKEMLRQQLASACTTEEAITACVMSLEQTACELAQDEQDELGRQRQQAVMALARRAPQLLSAAGAKGEIVLMQDCETAQSGMGRAQKIMTAAGVFALASLAVHECIDGKMLFALLQLAGGALVLLGGRQKVRPALESGMRARGIVQIDADAMVRLLSELCQAADICVGDLMLIERDAGAARLSGTADDAMLDLLVVLMEAKASGREDLAMRSLSQAQQYLHMLGVEIVHYDGQNAQLFDLLPTLGEARTIRPALMKDGQLLRRGAAACRMEGSARA